MKSNGRKDKNLKLLFKIYYINDHFIKLIYIIFHTPVFRTITLFTHTLINIKIDAISENKLSLGIETTYIIITN